MNKKLGPGPKYASATERNKAREKSVSTGRDGDMETTRWIFDQENPHKDLALTIRTLVAAQDRRLRANTFYMSLYANEDFMQPYFGNSAGAIGMGTNKPGAPMMPQMSDNMLRMCTDALAGKLVQSNARIVMQTRMGDFSEWRKARKLEMAFEGEFARTHFYNEAIQVAVDGITVGDGLMKLYIDYDGSCICAERVFPNEVFVDELEGAYGQPRKMYQLRYMRKDDLRAYYPQHDEIIRRATSTMPPRYGWTMYQPGMVEVFEGWALPTGNRPGRHIIAISSGVLFEETWTDEYFPFVRFKAGDSPLGYYGMGWAKDVAKTQVKLNRTWNVLDKAAHLGIAPYWVVSAGSDINVEHLTNGEGHVVTTAGEAPQWVVNPPFHPAAKDYLESLKGTILTFFGMNEMEVTGQLPINRLDSSDALREFQTMGSVRHTMILSRWQEFFVLAAERIAMLAKKIAKKKGGYPVIVKRSFANAIELDWKDLDMPINNALMNPAPASILPMTSAGRTNTLNKMAADGQITKEQYARAIASGQDVEAILSEVAADDDNIDRIIEKFTEHQEYEAPNSLMKLDHALVRMSAARLKYGNLGADEDVLSLFDRFLTECKDLVALLTPPPPMMPGAMPAGGPNVPGNPNPVAGGPSSPGGNSILQPPAAGAPPTAVPGGK